jgi:glucose-6-phosphate-specific signal transduction histidine kinase
MRYAHIIIIICLVIIGLVYLLTPAQATIVTSLGAGLAIARRKRDKMQTRLDRERVNHEIRAQRLREVSEVVEKKQKEREKWLDR